MLNKLTLIASAFTYMLLLSMAAMAADAQFYTGGEGGGYHNASKQIAERLEQRNIKVEVINRNGSDDITLQACNSDDPSIWVAQKDAIWAREVKDGCSLVDLGVYGTEYAMLFFPPDSRNDELSHLKASDSVLVDEVGSGSELTWKTMAGIEQEHGRGNDWSKATPVTESIKRATSMASRGTIQAVFLVRKTNSKDVERLISQGWELGYMYDKDINDMKWNGTPLYDAEKISLVVGGKRAGKNWAYLVPSYIGTTEQVESNDEELYDALLSALN